MDKDALKRRIILLFIAGIAVVAIILFGTAGTLDYWQAWAYMAVLFLPVSFVVIYFLGRDPEFLERRLRTKEREQRQGLIVMAATLVFVVGFLIPGLDQRFGWSDVPPWVSIAADALVFLGYAFVFLVFKENSYAGRTVQVDKGQKVVSTGPYAVIRHPMYLGTVILYLATPLALGSYVAVPTFMLFSIAIVYRILDEERVLLRDLPGYAGYCQKTRYRLIPFIW